MNTTFETEFKSQSLYYIRLNIPRIEKCLTLLEEDQIWQRPNGSSNSVGNLILHLCGNIRQYIISGIGHQIDERERDKEFSEIGGFTKNDLIQKLIETVAEAEAIIEAASEEKLQAERKVQDFTLTGVGIIIHVTEHFSYHVGQIAFWTKMLTDKDLGFYGNKNLNARNE